MLSVPAAHTRPTFVNMEKYVAEVKVPQNCETAYCSSINNWSTELCMDFKVEQIILAGAALHRMLTRHDDHYLLS